MVWFVPHIYVTAPRRRSPSRRGRRRLADSDFKRWSVPHWCVFTRVGTRKSKGEWAHNGRDCSPLKPYLPSALGEPWPATAAVLQTLSLVSQPAFFFFGSSRSEEETIYWVTPVFNTLRHPEKGGYEMRCVNTIGLVLGRAWLGGGDHKYLTLFQEEYTAQYF